MKKFLYLFFALSATSLKAQVTIGGIINNYTPVLSLNPCANKITVEDGSAFNAGDTVLLIQMKGAVIDSSNTSAFGTISDYKNAGNYELNYVKSRLGNVIELKNVLTRQYDLPDGKVQLVRVPYYQSVNITSELTALPWDGNKGGVLVLNVRDTVFMNANINVTGKGFRGGNDPVTSPGSFFCNENQFFYPVNPDLASEKGEGISIISPARSFGKGALGNGGGGGNSHNSGGGGGGNGGAGGFGGYNFEGAPCTGVPFDNRGIGGKQLSYLSTTNKIFMGGGGGAGHSNNPTGFQAKGGIGGGIVIIKAGALQANNNKIITNGANGASCTSPGTLCHEGMGGGGAAGPILLNITACINPVDLDIRGGAGADMTDAGNLRVGPGGGGGAGVVLLGTPGPWTAQLNVFPAGGVNGVTTAYGNNAFGTTPGQAGSTLPNFILPVDNILFKANIDSVRIKDSLVSCDSFDFKGFGYVNTSPVANWQWDFGDGGTAATQNTGHTYLPGTWNVKLVITDNNGCTDSISRNVIASLLSANAGPGDTICAPGAVTLQASSMGATQFSWTPAAYLNNPNILNPIASPPVTTMFYLTASNFNGCVKKDSVLITVKSGSNSFSINAPLSICPDSSAQLQAGGGDLYSWQPSGSLNNPAIPNPVATPVGTTLYSVQITDTVCNITSTLSTSVSFRTVPLIRANKTNDIDCSTPQSQLVASGGVKYLWSPATNLNNPASSSPIATPTSTTQYLVQGFDADGCVNTDSITVDVFTNINKGGYLMPTGFTPNNDGLNDCYRVKLWGPVQEIEFSIFNRWGERIFYTRDPSACWDGRYKGVMQDPAVFVYMIKAKTLCEPTVFRKGTFALIR